MSSNTTNLNLYKADPVADGNKTFNIKTMLNDNWDKIDTAVIAKFLEAKGYTDTKIQQLINSAPGALDTLKELADALGDDANFSATITNALALKAPLASPILTGTPSAPTPAADTNTTQIATTAFVLGQAGATTPQMDGAGAAGTSNKYARADHVHPSNTTKANLASPTFTGIPSAPTPAADTNTTQIATTAFVLGQAGATTPQMDGTGAAGTSNKYARADHVHPSNTTKANLASPTLTGTPSAPTPAADTNTTQIATTAFVLGQAGATTPQMDGAGAAGTSNKYARADHVHPSDATKANVASPILTGIPSAPTPAADTNTTQIATTAFVLGQAGTATPQMDGTGAAGTSNKYARADHVHPSDATKANIASPILTGTPSAPTPAADTNTTQIATAAFVLGQAGTTTPQMDGTGVAGNSNKYARADHVHPSDATKANVASPTFTGTVKTTNNTLDDGSGNMTAAGMITSKNGVKVNNQSTATLNSQLLGVPTAGYFMSGTSVGDTVLRNETNSNISFGFTGASGAENPALKLTYNATGASKVSTQRNTLDDGSGNIVMSNGVLGGTQSNFHVVPTNGGNVGFTNNLRNKWGVRVNDNASGNPQAYTYNNTLDDGNGGMTVGGLTVNSNAQINGTMYFKATSDNTDATYITKNDIAGDISSLDIVVGDNGYGNAISTPNSGGTDYVSIKSTNLGIHHIFGSDGTYKAATSVSAPTLTSTVGTGTAPLTVASTTKVNNLNADLLDGYNSDSFVQKYGYQTSNSGATYVGKYTKIASITITSQYGNCGATLALRNDGTGDYTDGAGFLQLRVKQQNALGSAPYASLKLFGNTNVLTITNFFAITTVNTTNATTVEFYYKESIYNNYLIFTPIVQSGSVSFYSNQAYLSALPSGTVTSCTQMGWNGDLNASGKLTTSNNTLDDGAGNLTVAGTLTTPSIKLTGDIINDGNERHFKASGTGVNWGYYVNSNGFGGYDWQNSRSVFNYSPSTNSITFMGNGGATKTTKNTLDDGSGNMTIAGTTTHNGSLTMTSGAGINFANDSSYAWRGITGTVGDNDFWRVGGGASATNGGYLEIATADDGNEPIYLRQYSGTFATIARTLTLLDGNGNSIFPGIISNYVSGDAVLQLETMSTSTSTYRQKRIYSSPNVGGGSEWLFRAIRPSDGACIDYHLGNSGNEGANTSWNVCTTYNEPSSKSQSGGYKKFADGLIIQWGNLNLSSGQSTITFPIAFPNNCLNVIATPCNASNPIAVGTYNNSATQFNVYVSSSEYVWWFAIGF